jgi:hypothetical protein
VTFVLRCFARLVSLWTRNRALWMLSMVSLPSAGDADQRLFRRHG